MSYWQIKLSIKLVFLSIHEYIYEYFYEKYSYLNMFSIYVPVFIFIFMGLGSICIPIHCEVFTPCLTGKL